jgi:hypothetical protein
LVLPSVPVDFRRVRRAEKVDMIELLPAGYLDESRSI